MLYQGDLAIQLVQQRIAELRKASEALNYLNYAQRPVRGQALAAYLDLARRKVRARDWHPVAQQRGFSH
jgi:hypothetical protein